MCMYMYIYEYIVMYVYIYIGEVLDSINGEIKVDKGKKSKKDKTSDSGVKGGLKALKDLSERDRKALEGVTVEDAWMTYTLTQV
jgi:hypothetical protein